MAAMNTWPDGTEREREMSEAIDVVRRMVQAFATGKTDDASDYIHSEYLNPATLERSDKRGPESFTDSVDWVRNAFSELHLEEIEYREGGGYVTAYLVMSGRHTGDLVGLPPTGRRFAAEQLHLCEVVDGRIRHHREWRDDLGCLRQLGLPALPD
ncbi:nogalonic acid methyl ester cyclase / aklanonic acid methyl ester cyclase [Streptomyces sp. KS_5]|nr:nogalonic acid methyl ester cyclase / aklanonic acid methyl ester cyclase [Streptomyces sp. KS_5]